MNALVAVLVPAVLGLAQAAGAHAQTLPALPAAASSA